MQLPCLTVITLDGLSDGKPCLPCLPDHCQKDKLSGSGQAQIVVGVVKCEDIHNVKEK